MGNYIESIVKNFSNIQFNNDIYAISVATTGLDSDAELISVTICCITHPWGFDETIYRKVPVNVVAEGKQYHRIPPCMTFFEGKDDDQFKEELEKMTKGRLFYAFNPGFQKKFLEKYVGEVQVYDYYALTRMLMSRCAIPAYEATSPEKLDKYAVSKFGRGSIEALCNFCGRPKWSRVLSLAAETTHHRCRLMRELWRLCTEDLEVQTYEPASSLEQDLQP